MFQCKLRKSNAYGLLFSIIILLFVFQSPLESVSAIFSYIDELASCFAFILIIMHYGLAKRKICCKAVFFSLMCLIIFVISGLSGNFLYKYQPLSLVLIDLLTNLKFFLVLATGYLLFVNISWETLKEYALLASKTASTILFLVFLADWIFDIYSWEVRYGIRSVVLFYPHSTYLAGALVFLLAMLTVFYAKHNLIYIGMDLFMLLLTLRSKAIAAVVVYLFLFWYVLRRQKQIRFRQLLLIGAAAAALAWEQVCFYYILLANHSARSIMTMTSFQILADYFPIGTGFATFASHSAAENYSPVYLLYGFMDIDELSPANPNAFLDDTFWPIVIGQTGFLGTAAYLLTLFFLVRQCFQLKHCNRFFYMGALFMMSYLLISSTAEPAFNNSIAIPLGFLLGMLFQYSERKRK